MKPRVGVYLSEHMAVRLAAAAGRPGATKSGLVEAQYVLKRVEGIAIIEFTRRDVVRHPLVMRIIEAYQDHRGKKQGE